MNEFFHMGGYGFYIWSTYALAFIVLVLNTIIPLRRETKLLQSIAKKQNVKNHHESTTAKTVIYSLFYHCWCSCSSHVRT